MNQSITLAMSQDMAQHHYVDGQSQDGSVVGPENIQKSCSDDAVQIEQDKQLIKSHPLFPLLELLFEKCERATRGEETPSSVTYDEEIQDFVRRNENIMNPIFIDNPEIDNLMIKRLYANKQISTIALYHQYKPLAARPVLMIAIFSLQMIKAIQVLRIHLLELEKVNDLCKDFCHRYITCLKGKMHSENLLRSDMGPFADVAAQRGLMHAGNTQCMASTPNANVTVNQQGEIVAQAGMYQQALTSDGQLMHHGENGIDGSTPLSQVGVSSPPTQLLHGMSSQHIYHQHAQHLSASGGHDENGRKTKRGVLPKHATEILRSWLFSHIVHPYPTEDEKRTLASQTKLTLLQVNNWFINARRRILQPMLDASNPEASSTSSATCKTKKAKPQANRPTDRFWPNSISTPTNGSHSNEEAEGHDPDSKQEQQADVLPTSPTHHSQHVHNNNDRYAVHESSPPSDANSSAGQHLHHYPHGDVTMTSGAQVPLSLLNN